MIIFSGRYYPRERASLFGARWLTKFKRGLSEANLVFRLLINDEAIRPAHEIAPVPRAICLK